MTHVRTLVAGLLTVVLVSVCIPAITSAPAVAKKPKAFRAVATLSTTSATAGQPVTVTVRFTPRVKRVRVTLQAKTASGWTKVGARKARARGTASFRLLARKPGVTAYRAVVSRHKKIRKGVSPAVRLTTQAWHYLADLGPVNWQSGYEIGSRRISGITYPKSVAMWFNTYNHGLDETGVDFDLRRGCTTFEATLGQRDDNVVTTREYTFRTIADAAEVGRTVTGYGESTRVAFNVRGTLRLGIRVTSTPRAEYTSEQAVWGDARVLCAW